MKPENQKNQKEKETDTKWSVISLAWQLGYIVAVPIVVFALLGRVLDKKLDTEPWLLLAGIFLSIITSTYLVYKKTMSIINKQ